MTVNLSCCTELTHQNPRCHLALESLALTLARALALNRRNEGLMLLSKKVCFLEHDLGLLNCVI